MRHDTTLLWYRWYDCCTEGNLLDWQRHLASSLRLALPGTPNPVLCLCYIWQGAKNRCPENIFSRRIQREIGKLHWPLCWKWACSGKSVKLGKDTASDLKSLFILQASSSGAAASFSSKCYNFHAVQSRILPGGSPTCYNSPCCPCWGLDLGSFLKYRGSLQLSWNLELSLHYEDQLLFNDHWKAFTFQNIAGWIHQLKAVSFVSESALEAFLRGSKVLCSAYIIDYFSYQEFWSVHHSMALSLILFLRQAVFQILSPSLLWQQVCAIW